MFCMTFRSAGMYPHRGFSIFWGRNHWRNPKKSKKMMPISKLIGGWNFRKKWGSHLALSKTDGLALISSNGASENDGFKHQKKGVRSPDKALVYPHGLNSPMFCTPKTDLETRPTPLRFPTSLSGDVIRSKSLFEKSLTPKQWMLWDREWSNLMVLWHPQNWIVQYIPTHSTMSWQRIWLLFNFTQQ